MGVREEIQSTSPGQTFVSKLALSEIDATLEENHPVFISTSAAQVRRDPKIDRWVGR